MSTILTRRRFLKTTALTGAALGLSSLSSPLFSSAWAAGKPLKVLILGGTGQTGPHLVNELLGRGHTVTLFNRGNRSAELFPDVECIVGDRDVEKPEGLDALKAEVDGGRTWDVCIDIWPHIPKLVEMTGTLLKGSVGHFMYVSSLSAYADNSKNNMDETAAVLEAPDADNTEFTMALFGPFKAECENRVRRIFPDNHTIYRPGLIVGPRDFSFRGVYWPTRVARGGEVLAPGNGFTRIQNIDARDLTAFQARCMEEGTTGTFNVVGPHPRTPMTMLRLLEGCKAASGSDATFTWVPGQFLTENQIGPWMQMPNWIPAEGEYAGFGTRSNARAIAAGLTFRSIKQTAKDTVDWYNGLDEEQQGRINTRAGISAEKEAEVLAAWHARK
jgi:2'-hydroxyisoflavone reductase